MNTLPECIRVPLRGAPLYCLLALASSFAFAQKTPNPAGTVELIEGAVTVQKADRSRVTPKVGDVLSEGDAVATGADGELHLTMQDGGFIAVRPATKMRIAQYQAVGEPTDSSKISILEGSLRLVSGWIAKFNPTKYQVATPLATIGIRGTDHEAVVRLKDDADGEAGVYDRVFEGGTFIRTDKGRVDVSPNRVGFFSAKKRTAPRVLDRVPGFFRATRNERLIEGRHARIQPQLQKLREDRRSRFKEAAEKARAEKQEKAKQEKPKKQEKAKQAKPAPS